MADDPYDYFDSRDFIGALYPEDGPMPLTDPREIPDMLAHGDPAVRHRREPSADCDYCDDGGGRTDGRGCKDCNLAADAVGEPELPEPARGWTPRYIVNAYFGQDRYWVTARGEHKDIDSMDTGHILNTILMLDRFGDDIAAAGLSTKVQSTALYRALEGELASRREGVADGEADSITTSGSVRGREITFDRYRNGSVHIQVKEQRRPTWDDYEATIAAVPISNDDRVALIRALGGEPIV